MSEILSAQQFIVNHCEGWEGFIEFRFIGPTTQQLFIPVAECFSQWEHVEKRLNTFNKQNFNVYFGVNPRTAEKGDYEHVPLVHCLWVDIDYKGELVEKNYAPLKAMNLNANVAISSGRGWHLYWYLKEAVPFAEAAPALKHLVRILGADPACVDAPRILRVPGTMNVKDPANHIPCEVMKSDLSKRFTMLDFDVLESVRDGEMPDGKKKSNVTEYKLRNVKDHEPPPPGLEIYGNGHGFAHAMAEVLAKFWTSGVRHSLALGLSGLLRAEDVTEDGAAYIIQKIAAMTGDSEVSDRLTAVKTTYACEKPSGSTTIIEILGEDVARDFFKAFKSVIRSVPPPPVIRAKLPDFDLYQCVPPGSVFDRYVNYASLKTDAPLQYHAAAILTAAAAALGNRVYVRFHSRNMFPNLYTLLCGPSTRMRKSESIFSVKMLMKALKVETYPKDATVELLYARLAPEAIAWANKDGTNCYEHDKGAKAKEWRGRPSGIIYHSEFSHYLSVSSKSYMQDSRNFFMDLYDGAAGGETRETKTQGKYTIEDAAISMLCGVTLSSIKNFVSSEDINNGFLARFLIVMPPRTHINKYGRGPETDEKDIDASCSIINQLTALSTMAGKATVTPEADKIFHDLDKEMHLMMPEFEDTEKEAMSSFLGRLSAMAFKIATIYGCAKNNAPLIDGESMQYAANFCRYSAKTLWFFFDEVKTGANKNFALQNEEKIVRAVRKAWGFEKRPVSQTTVYRACHLTSDQTDEAILSAVRRGLIREVQSGQRIKYVPHEVSE